MIDILFKKPSKEITIFKAENDEPKQVLLNGKTVFKIYKNGNGRFVAEKVMSFPDGFNFLSGRDLMSYRNAQFFRNYQECEDACLDYIRHHETKLVGLIQIVK